MSEEMVRDVFVSNLNKFLEARAKTQLVLAYYLNVSATSINKWAKGYNPEEWIRLTMFVNFSTT